MGVAGVQSISLHVWKEKVCFLGAALCLINVDLSVTQLGTSLLLLAVIR